MYDLKHWHGQNLHDHKQLYQSAVAARYACVTLTQYGTVDTPLYAAVMIKRASNPEQRPFFAQSRQAFQATFDHQASQGWGPVIISATGPAGDGAIFSGVFQKMSPINLTRLELTNNAGSASHSTLQGMNAEARARGLRPLCISSYGDSDNPVFAAIWQSNTGDDAVLWNNDGTIETRSQFLERHDAETSVWCQTAWLTLNKDKQYCSVFEAMNTEGGAVRENMTPTQYVTEFTDFVTNQGFLPICVQAVGDDADSATLAAIFVKNETPTKRQWTSTGPVANAGIEAKMRQAMTSSIIRHAAIAIVYQKRLVYARGFTLAEPFWSNVEPTTRFRLASCSKFITALSIFQLIQEKKLNLTEGVQDILKLKTPSGHPPVDPHFKDIHISHLLDHSSGLPTQKFEDLHDLQAAFADAGQSVSLPVSDAATDSFIATIPLDFAPGDSAAYSDCGYYLLGRVVKQLRGTSTPIEAHQKHLFDPLHITRIRRAKDLVADQEAGEARYLDPVIGVGSSVFPSPAIVPTDYGTLHLEILDGDGGLTAAVTDMARLLAIVLSQDDNPAMKRQTIINMLKDGAAISALHDNRRSGYGFDSISDLHNSTFFAQKGGSIADAHSVIEINGDWGIVACWGGDPVTAPWYPHYLETFSPDKDALQNGKDLFPNYGMPSL